MTKNNRVVSIINMEIMHSVFGHNRTAIYDYIKDFTNESFDLLKQIKQTIQHKNKKLAMDYFHQLKGPAGSSGFHRIYQLCEKAEKQIAQEDWNSANKSYDDIDKILKKLQIELEKKFEND